MKRTWLSIIMVVILSLSFAITAYAANKSEDNNTMDSATSIAVNESVYGSIGDKNDKDWYRVYVPRARQKFLCKRFSTKSRILRKNTHYLAYFPCPPCSPAGCGGMRAACGVNAVAARRGILIQGN